jgi:hypothetical protein
MPKTGTKSYALRIEGPLVKPLQALKKQHRRSLNAEINAALAAWVTASQAPATDAASVKSGDLAPGEGDAKHPTSRRPSRRKSESSPAENAPHEQTQVEAASPANAPQTENN